MYYTNVSVSQIATQHRPRPHPRIQSENMINLIGRGSGELLAKFQYLISTLRWSAGT